MAVVPSSVGICLQMICLPKENKINEAGIETDESVT